MTKTMNWSDNIHFMNWALNENVIWKTNYKQYTKCIAEQKVIFFLLFRLKCKEYIHSSTIY